MDSATVRPGVHIGSLRCPLLELPGELRNRIYGYTVEDEIIEFLSPDRESGRVSRLTCRQFFGLTQTCRVLRSEFLPLHRTRTWVSLTPQDLYEYIDIFLAPGTIADDKITGSITLSLMADRYTSACFDLKPLLQLLRRANNLHVSTFDIIYLGNDYVNGREPSIQNILADIYDIRDMDMFYEYMDRAMTALELEYDDSKGVEIIFELSPKYWETWMGEWSKPDHDPDYRIPIELEGNVVQWGRQCGMDLNRATGSHLTVNFRRGR